MKTYLSIFLLCLQLVWGYFPRRSLQTDDQLPRVTTPLGEIEGTILRSRLGKRIYSFRGIPYAKPPVGNLRFKPPVPVEAWSNVISATADGFSCPQPAAFFGTYPTSEDCLLLNVYSTRLPRGNENPKRPVIVYFYQGGLFSGTTISTVLGPQYLLDKELVLVTVNYRLGCLGFLATGDEESPGNYGFKDQVQALKFVRDNIAAFGGDPDSVTIAGCSAGGLSVYLHMLSPMSQGLFHRAIAMSGSAFIQNPIETGQISVAKKQARLVGCPDDTSASIVKCLRTKSAEEIVDSMDAFAEFGRDPLVWSTVIEEDYGQERFLPYHPIEIVASGEFANVPMITGVTKDEISWKAVTVLANASLAEALDQNFEKYAPLTFWYERDTERSKAISRELRRCFLGSKPIDNSSLPELAQLYNDAIVAFSSKRGAEIIAESSDEPVYFYKFTYQGRYSYVYLPESNGTVPFGVSHLDDLIYLFYTPVLFPEFKPSDPEVEMVEKLTKLWANFAKTGNPTPVRDEILDNLKWDPFTVRDQKYLDIGSTLEIRGHLLDRRYAKMEDLFSY